MTHNLERCDGATARATVRGARFVFTFPRPGSTGTEERQPRTGTRTEKGAQSSVNDAFVVEGAQPGPRGAAASRAHDKKRSLCLCASVARDRPASTALFNDRPECYIAGVTFSVEIEREDDGRWLAEIPALSGVMAYGHDRDEAVARVQALALRVIAERLEHREAPAEFLNVTFQAA